MSDEISIRIIADSRENSCRVPEIMESLGASVEFSQLETADYICSDRICIERKAAGDFISSIIDKRLFEQLGRMKALYDLPILIIEGWKHDYQEKTGIHQNAVLGAFSSIAIDYRMPVIWTQDFKETAGQIYRIAKREQITERRVPSIRAVKKAKSTKDMQEFFLSGLPDINTILGRNLLQKFGSPMNVFNADITELMKVEGIGKEKAKKIYEILNLQY